MCRINQEGKDLLKCCIHWINIGIWVSGGPVLLAMTVILLIFAASNDLGQLGDIFWGFYIGIWVTCFLCGALDFSIHYVECISIRQEQHPESPPKLTKLSV